MTLMQLTSRGTYGPLVPRGRGVSPLWQHFKSPVAQNSIVIYEDGTVREKSTFDTSELRPENHVDTFILGGTDFRCDDTSFQYQSLLAAGYQFVAFPEQNAYESTYRDSYTYEWTPEVLAYQNRLAAERKANADAQAEVDRLQRIASLEAELARLRGLGAI